jgi:hypothetical protein
MKMEALPPNLRDLSLCARIAGSGASRCLACSRNPGPESALELLPSSVLSSAQAFKAYPNNRALENRTFHLLFKPDILTCYQHGCSDSLSLFRKFLAFRCASCAISSARITPSRTSTTSMLSSKTLKIGFQ